MRRCRTCNLPEGKLEVVLNDSGVCNYCDHFERNRNGVLNITGREQVLARKLQKIKGKYEYDAAVGLSGGKDSTYVLYQMVKKYNLKVLAVTFDNGFLTDYARESVINTVKALGVEHRFYKPDWDTHRRFYQIAVRKMGNPCIACAVVGYFLSIKICCENKIPFFIHGRTPFQMYRNFHKNSKDVLLILMKLNFEEPSLVSNIAGYLSLLKNFPVKSIAGMLWGARRQGSGVFPIHSNVYSRINESVKQSIGRLCDSVEEARKVTNEFFVDSSRIITEFTPEFLAYFLFEKYDEEKVKRVLEDELGWRRPEDDNLLGHYDCALHDAAAYMYQKLNDVDMLEPDVAVMVRFGAMSRERAAELIRLNKPTASNTEKSLDSLCDLCEWSREDLEKTLVALKQVRVDKLESA
jgi:hypothetical protein